MVNNDNNEKDICNVFGTRNKEHFELLFNYIKNELKIPASYDIYDGTFKCITVNKKNYRRAVIMGHRFAYKNNMTDVYWMDSDNCFESCGYMQIAYMVMDENTKGNIMWGLDKHLPKDIKAYLNQLKLYLGVELFRTFVFDGGYSCFVLIAQGMEHRVYINKLNDFVKQYGLGPFVEIDLLDECGNAKNYSYFRKDYLDKKVKQLSK